jgi:hypothetical protein
MYFKSLAIFENPSLYLKKASIPQKKSSKIIEIFIKVPHFQTEASIPLKMSSKSLVIFIKASHILFKCFAEHLRFFEKPHITLKKPKIF